jgi:hypothetical protein
MFSLPECRHSRVAVASARLAGLDSAGRTFEVSGVQQLHGVGFLWGWHFYGRRVRVQIEFRKVEPDATLEEIRGDALPLLPAASIASGPFCFQ